MPRLPCLFVNLQREPNWNECPLNRSSPGILEKIKDSTIFPNELRPQETRSWKGARFGDWTEYILDGKPMPIEV